MSDGRLGKWKRHHDGGTGKQLTSSFGNQVFNNFAVTGSVTVSGAPTFNGILNVGGTLTTEQYIFARRIHHSDFGYPKWDGPD